MDKAAVSLLSSVAIGGQRNGSPCFFAVFFFPLGGGGVRTTEPLVFVPPYVLVNNATAGTKMQLENHVNHKKHYRVIEFASFH